jgi:hypothetical protein
MTNSRPSYAQILETNNLIQNCTDETYWLCVTRTVQESKLFPVPAYMMMSYLMAFYRYPSLLRKIEARLSAEQIGDRARNMGMKIQNPSMGWGMPGFYLLGREWLINMGLLRPSDALDDIIYVMDFWKRFQLSSHRNDGHITNKEFGHRAQLLPERQLQVFHADMFDCAEGDELHSAAQAFMASASQYGFLVSCESRISQCNSGPYKLADNREMIVRDFMELSESDFPWLDDVSKDVPRNNVTVTMAVKDCHFYLVDDWGSFESKPEFKPEHLVGIGLYTSDNLSDGYMPLGMHSREELIATFKSLEAKIREATTKLWKRIASWSRDQMLDAGAIVYFSIIKDLAHIAGVYEVDDWMKIDARAERFRPLLNDEFSRDALGELVGYVSYPSQQVMEYTMAQHSDKPTRMYSSIPYSVLSGEDYTASSGPLYPGISNLPPKKDAYRTTRGVLPLSEYNRLSQEWVPPQIDDQYRFLCDTWVKYHAGTPRADELYRLAQDKSRVLNGRGSALKRAEIDKLRLPISK